MNLLNLLNRTVRGPDTIVRYGEGAEHVIELWFPKGVPPFRTVVVIHGGFWSAEYDRAHIRPLCVELAGRGYLTAALEYHRVGQDRGGWPGTFMDIADGLDALPGLTDGLVRGERTVLLGHSAGGHLAVWAACRRRLPGGSPGHRAERLRGRGVVSLAGVCDLEVAHALDLDDGAVSRLLGGTPSQVPFRYRMADPRHLLPVEGHCVLVHGDEDDRVPLLVSERFHEAAVAEGSDITMTKLAGIGHFELIEPNSTVFPVVLDAIGAAFASHLPQR